jgi:hypothetical protein
VILGWKEESGKREVRTLKESWGEEAVGKSHTIYKFFHLHQISYNGFCYGYLT